jgi:hypothetical protein
LSPSRKKSSTCRLSLSPTRKRGSSPVPTSFAAAAIASPTSEAGGKRSGFALSPSRGERPSPAKKSPKKMRVNGALVNF